MRTHLWTTILLALVATTKPALAADFYVCDCDTDSDGDCQAGNDSANGTAPATPWQSYNKARQAFANLAPGDVIHLCRGGPRVTVGERSLPRRQPLCGGRLQPALGVG